MKAINQVNTHETPNRMMRGSDIPLRARFRRITRRVMLYLVVLSGSLLMIFPLFWMVSTSIKTVAEANGPTIVWWPTQPQFEAYSQLIADPQWRQYLLNSVFVTTLAVVGTLTSVAIVAYSLSRVEWPGRNIVFFLLLSTLMIPPQTTLVPQYVLFYNLGWINTFNPIVIPGFFAGGASFVFLLRQFMRSIPRDLDEAAMMDGANHLTIWWRIIIPMCTPVLATIAIFLFVANWNAFQIPLIYLQRTSLYTLPIAINNLYNPQQVSQPWPLIMAASVLATIPLMIGFVVAQRYVFSSIVQTGMR
ncbi:MAG: putative rhamnose oligosaccharide ABC transport system, permease component [Chloroflexi bacterium AL-W]|nr:putative rhamnose oligosaccharide ABC transport system, permease component [Chloroflexi bacterium AL-N1]NOK65291.1 putative rhamnose oligosaccharide ABC transport system, permease component [Chloroflexi bacterium AL-N10]NOK72444.1 putative rhamnose oligosaccharide ABC transport system, permease component [Chloroflexi bacterium AL-N5]NOK79470.1 putative rhamnose oligosaccharide ABC transport system, permease component [Chloroflexi bacterium AL-W]NOK87386.1 putative rhamnose oligosaccharide AB